jgi:hypothetical protein
VASVFQVGPLVGTEAFPLDPVLGEWGDHGGPTPGIPLLAGSPAIDAGVATEETSVCDQRGFARERGQALDIGAYETGNDTGYALWAMESIPAGWDSAYTGDAEADRVANGAEYAFLMDPQAADAAIVTYSVTGGVVRLTVPYRPLSTDLAYVVGCSENLLVGFSGMAQFDVSTMETQILAPGVTFQPDVIAGTLTYTHVLVPQDNAKFWRFRSVRLP